MNRFIQYSVGADAFLDQRRFVDPGALRSNMPQSLQPSLESLRPPFRRTAGISPNQYGPTEPGANRLEQGPLGRYPTGLRPELATGIPDFRRGRGGTGPIAGAYGFGATLPSYGGSAGFRTTDALDAALFEPGAALFPPPHPEAAPVAEPSSWDSTPPEPPSPEDGRTALREPPDIPVSVSEYLNVQRRARYDVYLERAWERFADERYPRALATFRLASTVRVESSEARRGAIYAAVASEQFMLSTTLLRTLLRDDPAVFTHKDKLRSRFASPEAYRERLNRLRDSAERPDASIAARALYAFLLWQDADWPSDEHAHARRIAQTIREAQPNGPYAIMLQRMRAAESARSGGERP